MENQHDKTQQKNVQVFDSRITHVTLNHRVCMLANTFYGVGHNKQEAGKYGNDVEAYHRGKQERECECVGFNVPLDTYGHIIGHFEDEGEQEAGDDVNSEQVNKLA